MCNKWLEMVKEKFIKDQMYRDNMLKNKRIEIRVSNKELVSIRNTAKRNNTTVSNLLRKRI